MIARKSSSARLSSVSNFIAFSSHRVGNDREMFIASQARFQIRLDDYPQDDRLLFLEFARVEVVPPYGLDFRTVMLLDIFQFSLFQQRPYSSLHVQAFD